LQSKKSEAVRELLAERVVHTHACPVELVDGVLRLVPQGSIEADRVVALPRLHGPRIDGLPQTVEGFIPIDAHCRVLGLSDVFAAGDITSFPVKQGGIAAQQADAAAEMIAANAGVDLVPRPFRPVLRGLLLTGRQPRYLRHENHRRRWRRLGGESRASVVAAGEDRRALPRPLPRHRRGFREPTRGALRSRGGPRQGRARA
jgi:hypothetical protein